MNHWWKIKIITDNKETISGFILTASKIDPIADASHIPEVYHLNIRERKSTCIQSSTYTIPFSKITYIQTYYLGTEPSQVGYDAI
jgi:hypothetical protein